MALDKDAQSTIIYLQYLMVNMKDRVDILPVDKHQKFSVSSFYRSTRYALGIQINSSTISI